MPRFFDWLQKSEASGAISSTSVKKLCKLLQSKDVEITTEYAIPLIFKGYSKPSSDKIAGIIADDVIIFGATLQRVSMQWWAFSGEVPYIIALFRGANGVLPSILESESTLLMPRLKESELESALDIISRNIHSTSLPIDIEYPLIYSDMPYEDVKAYIQDHCPPEWERYEVKSSSYDDSAESFTVILDNGRIDGLTNDHAKIRLFKKPSGCCIEMIAPSHIKVKKLRKKDLFPLTTSDESDDSKYAGAWQLVLKEMNIDEDSQKSSSGTIQDNQVNNAILSTLVIWAEYLYCLSAFIGNRSKFFPDNARYHVNKEDISLILGEEMSDRILNDITAIIRDGETVEPQLDKITLEEYVNPKEIQDEYLRKVATVIKEGASVSDNLDAVFSVSHFSSNISKSLDHKNTSGHHCIGESFESLMLRIKQYHPEGKETRREIHKWVDVRIDECRIAPKYIAITGSDGNRYFRRFLLCGSNKI